MSLSSPAFAVENESAEASAEGNEEDYYGDGTVAEGGDESDSFDEDEEEEGGSGTERSVGAPAAPASRPAPAPASGAPAKAEAAAFEMDKSSVYDEFGDVDDVSEHSDDLNDEDAF